MCCTLWANYLVFANHFRKLLTVYIYTKISFPEEKKITFLVSFTYCRISILVKSNATSYETLSET